MSPKQLLHSRRVVDIWAILLKLLRAVVLHEEHVTLFLLGFAVQLIGEGLAYVFELQEAGHQVLVLVGFIPRGDALITVMFQVVFVLVLC